MFSEILVTGGAGFIGSHLANALIIKGFKIDILDNLSTGSINNLQGSIGKEVNLIKGDVRDKIILSNILKNVSTVFHLAAITSVPFSMNFPQVTYEVNVNGTNNLLEACIQNDVEKFIFISTCAVYGNPRHLPIDEKHPLDPISPYSKSKLEAEKICKEFEEKYDIKVSILRLFNIYGPRQKKGQYAGVIAKFMECLSQRRPPMIYGNGAQSRDFLHVNDATNAIISTLRTDSAFGEIINIATGVPTSINNLAHILIQLFGMNGIKPLYLNERQGDILHSYANIEKAKALLNFKPKITLRKGLKGIMASSSK